ncbi:hypothetical protein SERLA73DRAFT_190375 [Serpula lacrymans var. lacrymans S7.3]|uniref:Heterokaryon incompatibility domain-containing protein n=2 Tax=Serpula lacrymans var. lacrymans TaxID=341189 RepID=F8QFK2_SERL3|nr:uncharacterized protein SERLADRAFT_479427 [Serpula lacrymans var. lacrymans S7.9]EGN92986.1 hypothetical protein SERLA73DRAFT_190375 [Serpula lacrymans var. lacrymans S7.3]EGO19698.1 hypothetical protein SERLADRAFT_479427 [Serpula lacrymans var. lacrymans S7.9]
MKPVPSHESPVPSTGLDPTIADDIFETLTRYIYDEMPIRLISLDTMKLVERGDPETTRRNAISSLVKEVVKYAILSHRWLDKGEPTYQEMLMEYPPVGPGYDKLGQFCRLAREYGTEFAWSDTCCIDKTSSSELDESIRSMFKWYKTAHICIVFLAQTTSLSDMPNDPWFKRGWTLQELLAPQYLKFFGSTWAPLTNSRRDIERQGVYTPGTSSPLLAKMSDGSGITEADLLTFSPGAKLVHIRMPWAARRLTTRGEDRAYSLMGIFDVSFPIAYGEGLQRAFCRLVDAIMHSSPSTEILNWAGESGDSQVSRAIPSSPDCYNYPASTYANLRFFSRQQLAITSMGLRVSLLLLQSEMTFRCDAYDIGDITVQSKLTGKWNLRALDPRWALGIYNYYQLPNNLQLEQVSVAYLLTSTLFGWMKIPTKDIISFHVPNCNESGLRDASDKELVSMLL